MKEPDVCCTVEIEMENCILCGVCSELAPQIFSLNDAGYIEVNDNECYDSVGLHHAVANCPKDCIILKYSSVD